MIPEIRADEVPSLTTEQMREVDRVMIEDLGIELLQMMENAGRSLAELALRRFAPGSVTVLAGSGGNGGGGLVAARHLANHRVEVIVTLSSLELSAAAAHQLRIVRAMGIPVEAEPRENDLAIDALIGYSLSGDPRARAAELVGWANASTRPVLSLDVPSGLDATSGRVGSPCVRATATMTLALPKAGLREAGVVGELYLADISVPPSVYGRFGLDPGPVFAAAPVVRLV